MNLIDTKIDDGVEKNDILKALETLQKHPEVLEKLIDSRHKELRRRSNWSKLSNAPYYRERFAIEFREALDIISQDWTDREYKYVEYPELSKNTLYTRVNQSKLYLLDNLDPDGHYKKILERIAISKEKTGIRLHVSKESEPILPSIVSVDEQKSLWQQKIDRYVDESKVGDRPLHLKDLSLTTDEVLMLKDSFENLESIMALITPTEVKLVKIK